MFTPLFPETILEDSTIIVLNKPSGLLVIPDRYDHSAPNLYSILSRQYGEIFVVHRIDKETSGLILFAKTKIAHASLSHQFEGKAVAKLYLAICKGDATRNEGIIELPIAENHSKKGKMKIDPRHGKDSTTKYRVLEDFEGYVFVEAAPETGRMHQIRVHLASMNLPIVADTLYGGETGFFLSDIKPGYRSKDEEKPLLNRVALHATRISFAHPETGRRIIVDAGLPKDMKIVLNYLRRFRGRRTIL